MAMCARIVFAHVCHVLLHIHMLICPNLSKQHRNVNSTANASDFWSIDTFSLIHLRISFFCFVCVYINENFVIFHNKILIFLWFQKPITFFHLVLLHFWTEDFFAISDNSANTNRTCIKRWRRFSSNVNWIDAFHCTVTHLNWIVCENPLLKWHLLNWLEIKSSLLIHYAKWKYRRKRKTNVTNDDDVVANKRKLSKILFAYELHHQ